MISNGSSGATDAVRSLVRLGADRDVRGPRRGRHLVDVEDRLSAEPAPRERGGLLSAREESLLQIAALVAGGASSADVFAAVAREVGQVVGLPVVGVWRYEPGQMTATVIGAWGKRCPSVPGRCPPAARRPERLGRGSEHGSPRENRRLHRDSQHDRRRHSRQRPRGRRRRPDHGRRHGLGRDDGQCRPECRATRPPGGSARPVREVARDGDREHRKHRSSRPARDEQAALRRVAMLVARGARPAEVFASVANEVTRLLSVDFVNIGRYESHHTVMLVASTSEHLAVGTRWPFERRASPRSCSEPAFPLAPRTTTRPRASLLKTSARSALAQGSRRRSLLMAASGA